VGRDVTCLGDVDILKKSFNERGYNMGKLLIHADILKIKLVRRGYNMGKLFIYADILKKVLKESGL
jgi:hypothetical protein